MSRWTRFFIILIVGFGIGLLYGWVLNPVEYVDTNPESLRADFKTDYVLMVAEIYQSEKDLELAASQLAFLGTVVPENLVQDAMFFAVQQEGYSSTDLSLLRELSDAFQGETIIQGENQP